MQTMRIEPDPRKPFAFTRIYAFISLAAVLATAIALAILYRQLSIRTIADFGEQSNVTVARTLLNTVLPQLAGYVEAEEPVTSAGSVDAVPPRLLALITATLRNTPLERVKVYNKNGVVLYSTREHEIGADDSANPRFLESIAGNIRSQLRYRDVFNLFDHVDADDNLIETYVPIRQPGMREPIGVFEIYTDVNSIVRSMARNELLILAGIAAIMTILYVLLLYVVRRSGQIIESQRRTILDRNATLELLSAHMLAAEETERRRVAWELHEEIAQTLSAVKMRVEALAGTGDQPLSGPAVKLSEGIVPMVQDAIRDVRALAMDLRPPTLDDFGLIVTMRALCREAEQAGGGGLKVASDITAREEDVPDALKSVIFRVVQQTLKRLVTTPGVTDVRVALRKTKGLELSVDFSAEARGTDSRAISPTEPQYPPLTDLWERVVLAGGSLSSTRTDTGRSLYQATWSL